MLIHTLFTGGDCVLGLVYLEFFIAACIIVLTGRRLTILGDKIADVTGLGKLWIGATLLALATSLPEVVTSTTAALKAEPEAINLAFGNVLGSETFNLLMIVLMDIMYRQGPILSYAGKSHLLTASFGVVLIGMAGGGIAGGKLFSDSLQGMGGNLFSAGLSVAIFAFFLWAMHRIYLHQKENDHDDAPDTPQPAGPTTSNTGLYGQFALMAVFVTGAAIIMIEAADVISGKPIPMTDIVLGKSLVGTILVALATSLPEMTVTVSAMRLGSIDIALGNVLGSNLMNIVILPMVSLISWRSIFTEPAVQPVHILTAFVGILMTVPVIVGLKMTFKPRLLRVGYGVWAMVVIYGIGVYFISRLS